MSTEAYEDLLMHYACGALDEALALLVASHLTLSPSARQRVALYEDIGGTLMEKDCAPVAMADNSLRAVLSRLECATTKAACCPKKEQAPQPENMSLPQPLCRAVGSHKHHTLHWRTVYPGIAVAEIPVHNCTAKAVLLRAQPGAKAPRHYHTGTEITLVLQGRMQDRSITYQCGDVVIMEKETAHSPVADETEGCLCFTVTDAPLRRAHISLRDLIADFFRF